MSTEPTGKNFHPDFEPDLTPKQMLKMGIFGGAYFPQPPKEFPRDWFDGVEVRAQKDPELNYFKVPASQSLQVWQEKGWINERYDPKGWFQWYCRYYLGRRIPDEDERQIKRWKAMRRHVAQIKKNCRKRDLECRKKQRQALLHWGYDSRKL